MALPAGLQCLCFVVQLWDQRGSSIVNRANGHCLSVANVSCGHLGVCNPGFYQTGVAGYLWSIVAEPCSSQASMQSWSLQQWENVTPPQFVFLNISAENVPAEDVSIGVRAAASQSQVCISNRAI